MALSMSYFMPIIAFFFVFVIVYALLAKTKILGENNFVHLFISFILATIFVVAPTAVKFTQLALPWVAVFIISLVVILLILAFVGGTIEDVIKNPFLMYISIVMLLIIFLVTGIRVFGPIIEPLVSESGPGFFLTQSTFLGAMFLVMIGIVVSWVLTKSK